MARNYTKDFNLNDDVNTLIDNMFDKILNRKPNDEEKNYFIKRKSHNLIKLHGVIQSREYIKQLETRLTTTKKSVKFAIQISGHFRNFDKHKAKWQTFMDLNRDKVDIFIHTWKGTGLRTSEKWIDDSAELNGIENIIKVFNPHKFLIEDTKNYLDKFSVYNNDKNIQVFYNNSQPSTPDSDFSRFIVAQLYSVYKVNRLRADYENLHNFKYDFVFRIRADSFVNINLDSVGRLSNADNILYINSSHDHTHPLLGRGCAACNYEYPHKIHKNHSNLVCDAFYYGSGKIMDKISSIYTNHMSLLKEFEIFNKEKIDRQGTLRLSKNIFPGYIVHSHIGEELIYKCFYPERLIIETAIDDFLITDPLSHYVEIK